MSLKNRLPRISTIVLVLLLIGCVLVMFTSFGEYPEDKEIKIAVLMPFSGSMSEFGVEYARGVTIAVEELNSRFGNDYTYVVNYFDTTDDASTLLNTFMSIYDAGYRVVVGPVTSTEALTIAKYADILEVVLISPGATSDELSQYDQYVFRTVSSDKYLGSGLGKMVGSGHERVLILHTDDSYGKGLVEAFNEELSEYDAEIVGTVKIPTDSRHAFDYNAVIALMEETNPDSVFGVFSNDEQLITLLEMADAKGLYPQWYVTDMVATSGLLECDAAEGVIAGVPSRKAMSSSYAEDYKEKFGVEMPTQDSIYGYDTMMVLSEVINSCGCDPASIASGLREILYVGQTGAIVFDESGDRYPLYDLLQVKDGEWVTIPWYEVMKMEVGEH